MKKIRALILCNETIKVGENEVLEILEHASEHEGDKWFYDVFMNGKTRRIFDAVESVWEEE